MARDTKTDTHNLALALDAIRRDLPTAKYALFETSDQSMGYGFWFHGVAQGPDGGPEVEAGDSLFGEVRDYVEDIDWNGVMGEDKHGNARIDLTTAVSHDFPDRPSCTTCTPLPDDANETARKIIATWTRGLITLAEMVEELQKVAAAEHVKALQAGAEIAAQRRAGS